MSKFQEYLDYKNITTFQVIEDYAKTVIKKINESEELYRIDLNFVSSYMKKSDLFSSYLNSHNQFAILMPNGTVIKENDFQEYITELFDSSENEANINLFIAFTHLYDKDAITKYEEMLEREIHEMIQDELPSFSKGNIRKNMAALKEIGMYNLNPNNMIILLPEFKALYDTYLNDFINQALNENTQLYSELDWKDEIEPDATQEEIKAYLKNEFDLILSSNIKDIGFKIMVLDEELYERFDILDDLDGFIEPLNYKNYNDDDYYSCCIKYEDQIKENYRGGNNLLQYFIDNIDFDKYGEYHSIPIPEKTFCEMTKQELTEYIKEHTVNDKKSKLKSDILAMVDKSDSKQKLKNE